MCWEHCHFTIQDQDGDFSVEILIKGLDEEISFRGGEVISGRHRRTGRVFDENVDAVFRTPNGIYASSLFHVKGEISKFCKVIP